MNNIIKWIKYKSPWRYITYSKTLYENNKMRITFYWKRERHWGLGFQWNTGKSGPTPTECWDNEEWFVNKLSIYFIFATFVFFIQV